MVLGDDTPEEPDLGVTVTFTVGLGEGATVGVPEHATIAAVTQPERQTSASRFSRQPSLSSRRAVAAASERRQGATRRATRSLTQFHMDGWFLPFPHGRISMPLTWALSLTVVNTMVIFPVPSGVAVNCSTTALFTAPAAATMSKLVSTCCPLILTLKIR